MAQRLEEARLHMADLKDGHFDLGAAVTRPTRTPSRVRVSTWKADIDPREIDDGHRVLHDPCCNWWPHWTTGH